MKKTYFLAFLILIIVYSNKMTGQCIDPSKINPNCFCAMIYDPVCGCDGKVYTNSCFARCNGVTKWLSLPSNLTINGPQYICKGDTVKLTATGALYYYWSTGEYDSCIFVSPDNTTTYTVEAGSGGISFGCTITASLTLTVYPSYINELDTCILYGDTLIMGNSKYYYPGRFIDTLQTINGCDSIIMTTLNVLPVDSSEFLSINEDESILVDVYPNPAQKYLVIKSPVLLRSYYLYGINGELKEHKEINNSEIIIHLGNLKSGTYILLMNTHKNQQITRKILISN